MIVDEQSEEVRVALGLAFKFADFRQEGHRMERWIYEQKDMPWEAWERVTRDADNGVLQDWATRLPRRFQGALVVALRGCDLTRKPYDKTERCPERDLTAFLRFLVMNAADPREIDVPGAFFRSTPPDYDWKPSEFGHYPEHWYSHLMHAFEVVGYEHPDPDFARWGNFIYVRMVHNLHLSVESRVQMWRRLTEDRLASGTVVS